MKYFSFVLVLFIAQLTFAQTKTGSGGGVDERDNFEALFGKDVLYNEIGSNPKGFDKLKFGTSPNAQFLVDLSSVLHFQNEICREKNKAAIDMKYMSYMDIYMALVLTKTSSLVKGKCVDNSAYFECMGSDNLKDAFNGTLKNKGHRIYLKTVYGMSEEQIDDMINFFKEIDKTCEIDVCKM